MGWSLLGPVTAAGVDYNGDGTTDLLWQNVDGSAGLWIMRANALFNSAVFGPYTDWSPISGSAQP